jgi:hypothetical protein
LHKTIAKIELPEGDIMTNQPTCSSNSQNREAALSTLAAGTVDVCEFLEAAQTAWGCDLQTMTLREVLVSARGVNARIMLARLTAFGIENAESVQVRDVLDSKHLAMIVDALSANDRHAPTPQWPFAHNEP